MKRLRWLAMLPIGLAALTACSGSPVDKARKAERSRRSWLATLEMAAEARGRGAIPEAYARQVESRARAELGKQSADR